LATSLGRPWGYKLHRRDDANIITAGRAQKALRDQRNHSQVTNVLAPTATQADASKFALFPYCHRIDAAIFVSVFDALVQVAYHQERSVSLINVTKAIYLTL
jgi:hypothetical protein